MKKISLSKVLCIAFAFCAAAAIASPAQNLTTLVSFDGTNGSAPAASLIQASDGNLYGTTEYGGPISGCEGGFNPCGTVFKITTSGTLTTLHTFVYSDGAFPVSPVVQGSDGNFYGTNQGEGDSGGAGAIFKMTPGGTVTVLSFTSSPAGLVQGRDGNFYGTTPRSYTNGTVFKITPSGTLTTLHTFNGTDGDNPQAGLIQATDGNFYGTTFSGGTSNYCGGGCGTVFKITPGGSLTTLHSFSGTDGYNVQAGLVEGSDGNFYGTTVNGGAQNVGEVYKITPSGSLTVLYSFCSQTGCTDGAYPKAGLMQATDGNFYGTTSAGGANNSQGTVFAITPGGSLTTLYSFCAQTGCADGTTPVAGVVQASDGNFYGTTYGGGSNNSGTVFRMPIPVLTNTVLTSAPDPSYVGQAVTLTATVTAQNGSTPTGTVVFQSNGANIGSASLNGSGVAVLVYSGWGLGSYNLTAVYQGSGNLVGSTSNTVVQVVEISPTTTVLTSKPNPSNLNQPVTLTATVTAANGSTPTGNVVFNSNSVNIGSASLNNSGVAILVYSAWGLGSYNLTAVYQGSGTLAGSTSNTVVQVVGGTTTAVTSSPNPSTVGEQVTITATVSPGASGGPTPTGTVSFTSNGAAIAGCTAVPLPPSLIVVCMTSTLAVGTDTIVATYSGDSNYLGSSGTLTQIVNPVPSPVQFVPVTPPCRLMDTRTQYGGGGPIQGQTFETFDLQSLAESGKFCPAFSLASAAVYSLNVTVVPPAPLGYLTIWPAGEGRPLVSTLNSLDGRIKANAAIVPGGASGAVSVYVSNTTDVVLDIDGYFETGSSSTLAFYTLPPCRVADTRKNNFPQGLGAPYLSAWVPRDFPVLSSTCNIPDTAVAYSLNFTAVPYPALGDSLGYLELWPTGEKPQHPVSTLNNPKGTIVANAAIVPAGTGSEITALASDDTHLVIDINGYFAAPGSGGLSLYPVTPCRVIDTRKIGNGQPFTGDLTVNVVGSACSPPSTAQAYVFNATVVPPGGLGFLTLWPDCAGCNQPLVSTLNALDGAITSNMAIVPNSDGSTDAYASDLTQLILDISSYFAP